MPEIEHSKLIILGSGAAGYTAGIYAARANLNPKIITGMQLGGQLSQTPDVENFPGFPEKISGIELMDRMHKQCENLGVEFKIDTIIKTNLESNPIELIGETGKKYTTDALIIATGSSARWLNIESEKKYRGNGVSACATCDGFFYRNKEVFVIGGGNSAVTEALFLSNICKKVTIVHRRNSFRAEPILIEKIQNTKNIDIIWNAEVDEILGEETPTLHITGLKLKSKDTEKIKEYKTDGIFIAIGHKPNTDIFKDQLDLDEKGYIITKNNLTQTNLKNVFAAGDVIHNAVFHQAVTAAGLGCSAALEAQDYFLKHKK